MERIKLSRKQELLNNSKSPKGFFSCRSYFWYNVYMKILTLLTKRSVREVAKERKFVKFYSLKDFAAGDMIEIITANKKTPTIVLKSEDAREYKEEIRSGNMEIQKLVFSKTGENASGVVYDHFDIADIKKYLKKPVEAKKSENKNISGFFPRVNTKKVVEKKKSKKSYDEEREVSGIGDLMTKKILEREKTYNNPMQELVDTIRKYFYENARFGFGSFSYYIGMFKNLPLRDVEQIFAETKILKKRNFEKKKIF